MKKRRLQKPEFRLQALPACDHKRHFKTEAEALEAADLRMLDNMTLTIGIYACPICSHWHLTRIKEARQ